MEPVSQALSFTLRDVAGRVEISYQVNDDPARWGYGLLGMDGFDVEAARGFPVTTARTSFPAEGYAGLLGWIQVVDYTVTPAAGPEETVWVVPDVAPQARDANTPFLSFGIDPVMFDAPATDERDARVDWTAHTYLTATPDCLMTPVVEPVCGFSWGYVLADGAVSLKPMRPSVRGDWHTSRKYLGLRLPTWEFRGDEWDPPGFD